MVQKVIFQKNQLIKLNKYVISIEGSKWLRLCNGDE